MSGKASQGIALILVLLITVLLYIFVSELVTRSSFDRLAAGQSLGRSEPAAGPAPCVSKGA